jgi:glycosyltransferase involved in cell wall biosynthesis
MNEPVNHRRRHPDLAVFLSELAQGGIGKMRAHLMNAFVERGVKVDLVLGKTDSPYREMLDDRIRVIDNRTSHAVFGVPRFAGYLATARPPVTLVQRVRVNVLAHRARSLVASPTRLFVTANTHISRQLESMSRRKAEQQLAQLRRYYPRNAGIIAISRGVADDLARLIDVPPDSIRVAPNPSASPGIFEQARAPVHHPWFAPGEPPVVLGVGRLQPQKDFPTLLRAFAHVRARRPARLVILGEGPLREELLAHARELQIGADVDLPGFMTNP